MDTYHLHIDKDKYPNSTDTSVNVYFDDPFFGFNTGVIIKNGKDGVSLVDDEIAQLAALLTRITEERGL